MTEFHDRLKDPEETDKQAENPQHRNIIRHLDVLLQGRTDEANSKPEGLEVIAAVE